MYNIIKLYILAFSEKKAAFEEKAYYDQNHELTLLQKCHFSLF